MSFAASVVVLMDPLRMVFDCYYVHRFEGARGIWGPQCKRSLSSMYHLCQNRHLENQLTRISLPLFL